jgi:hypothetical protein
LRLERLLLGVIRVPVFLCALMLFIGAVAVLGASILIREGLGRNGARPRADPLSKPGRDRRANQREARRRHLPHERQRKGVADEGDVYRR